MAKLGEVCTIVSGSTPKTSVTSYWDGNIKWITPAELNEDTFYIMDSVRHITEEGKEKPDCLICRQEQSFYLLARRLAKPQLPVVKCVAIRDSRTLFAQMRFIMSTSIFLKIKNRLSQFIGTWRNF